MQFILLIVEYRNVLVATHNMTGVSEYPLYLLGCRFGETVRNDFFQ